MSKKTVIIGAGISGLTLAYWLKKNDYDVIVLDKKNEPGGVMESFSHDGFLFDQGPNSGLETSPLIKQIVDDVGISDDFTYASTKGENRYILKGGKLHPIPMKPNLFLTTKLFSAKAKFRIMMEPLFGRSKDGYYQSLAEFVKRRLGQEFLDYMINPFVAGVFAGTPEELSVKSAFPKLYALEENHGGIFRGTIATMRARKKSAEKSKSHAKMFSFKSGMQIFPKSIANYLGDSVITQADVIGVHQTNSGYQVTYEKDGNVHQIDTDAVVSAIPAYSAAELLKGIDLKLYEHLTKIYYPPVLVLYLAYNVKAIKQKLDGFGFLIPEKERKNFLGAIWSSVLFPNRTINDTASFTLFVGGSRNPEISNIDKDIVFSKAIKEFEEIMGITEAPVFQKYKFWKNAIPQYNIGYIEHENYFTEFEEKNKGLFLTANYRGGISVGDCVKNSDVVFNRVKNYLDSL